MNTLVYSIEQTENPETLYINLTNSCTNNCIFCLRTQKDDVCGKEMWLENENFSVEDIIKQFEQFSVPRTVCFCGYGEPMLRLELLKAFAKYLKENHPDIYIRVNTNGHANAIQKRNILPELKGLVDEFSVSLNGSSEEEYNSLSKPRIHNAYDEVKKFIKAAAESGFTVIATVVTGYVSGVPDAEKCKNIAESLGAKFRAREFIPNGY